jgi:hypothetical protein
MTLNSEEQGVVSRLRRRCLLIPAKSKLTPKSKNSISRRKARVPRNILDQGFRAVLQYGEGSISATTTTTPTFKQFRGNDCYDPNYLGVGHQPRRFDQLMALYTYCLVERSEILIDITSSDRSVAVLFPFYTTGSTPATVMQAAEYEKAKTALATTTVVGHLYNSLSIPQMAGVNFIDPIEWACTASGSPSHNWIWSIALQHPDESTSVTTDIVVRMRMHCRFFGLVNPAAS